MNPTAVTFSGGLPFQLSGLKVSDVEASIPVSNNGSINLNEMVDFFFFDATVLTQVGKSPRAPPSVGQSLRTTSSR